MQKPYRTYRIRGAEPAAGGGDVGEIPEGDAAPDLRRRSLGAGVLRHG